MAADDSEIQAQRRKHQEKANDTKQEVWWRGEKFTPQIPGWEPPAKPVTASGQASGAKVYKVLTQRDEWFMGKFSPEKLEAAVNHYASAGWRIVGVATADVGAFWGSLMGGNRQEIVVFMEMDLK